MKKKKCIIKPNNKQKYVKKTLCPGEPPFIPPLIPPIDFGNLSRIKIYKNKYFLWHEA